MADTFTLRMTQKKWKWTGENSREQVVTTLEKQVPISRGGDHSPFAVHRGQMICSTTGAIIPSSMRRYCVTHKASSFRTVPHRDNFTTLRAANAYAKELARLVKKEKIDFDSAEAAEDKDKVQRVVALARLAYGEAKLQHPGDFPSPAAHRF